MSDANRQGNQQQNNLQKGKQMEHGYSGSKESEARPKNETRINDSNSAKLKNKILEENNDDYLEIIQGDEKSPLHPLKPFAEIIKGPKSKSILQVINELHFYQPSKIQSQAIPILNKQKKDLIAQAQSGSGKTVAFLVSMLLHVNDEIHQPQAICLCHTRELTNQTFDVFTKLNKYTKFVGDICVKSSEESEPN